MKTSVRKPSPVDTHVAKKIAERRLRLNLSQSYVAKQAGITQQGYDQYENGASRIPVGRFFAICVALKVSPDEMFEGLDAPRLKPGRQGKSVAQLLKLAMTYLDDGAPMTAADCLRDALRETLLIADMRRKIIDGLKADQSEDMDVV